MFSFVKMKSTFTIFSIDKPNAVCEGKLTQEVHSRHTNYQILRHQSVFLPLLQIMYNQALPV